MSRTFKIQPAEFVDHVTDDGRELTQLPRPFFVDEKGFVGRQDYWNGSPYQVIGFAEEFVAGQVDLLWKDALDEPSQAVGMYLVATDDKGGFATYDREISSVELIKSEKEA